MNIPGGGPARLWQVPGFVALAASSWMWHVTRWGTLFCSTYLMTQMSGAPILNQLVGAAVFAPLLLGGLGVGALADRISRRTLILRTELALIPLTVAMYALVATDAVRPWMIFPYALAVGTGGLVNVVSQRPMMYEIGGPRFASKALAVEMAGSSSSSVAGALLGGVIIQTTGIAAAFGLTLVPLVLSALLLLTVPDPTVSPRQPPSRDRAGAGATARPRRPSPDRLPARLVSILGVTVILNLCVAPYVPLVPVMAGHLGATAFLTGVLAAAGGTGQLCGGIFIGSRVPTWPGRAYSFGVAAALFGVIGFGLSPALWTAAGCLLLGGFGHGCFNATQSVLVMESVAPLERGWALGKLSMAIGVMPVGQISTGLIAEAIGARAALVSVAVTGVAALSYWLVVRPEVVHIRSMPNASRPSYAT